MRTKGFTSSIRPAFLAVYLFTGLSAAMAQFGPPGVRQAPLLSQTSVMNLYNQNVKVTFSYRIGKMTFEEKKKKSKSVNNDDVKGDVN